MHIHFLPESWKWKMGVSPIRLTFQISSHFPLNHDFRRKSIYENANLKPATCYIWLLIVLVISTWWRVVSYESHHVKRKRVKWTKSGAQNDTFNSLYGDPVGDRCYFSSTNPLLQGSIHIWYIYIYIIYVYIIVYMCIFIFLCNYIFSFIHTDTSKTRCSEIGLGKSHYPGIEQGASNHRSQGGEKLHKQRSVCSRSEARLEPKQQNKTPRQSTKAWKIIWGFWGVDWVLGYIRTSGSKRTSVYLCQT